MPDHVARGEKFRERATEALQVALAVGRVMHGAPERLESCVCLPVM